MTPREEFIAALDGKQPQGRVPHFELVFYLTMEALGRVHPAHRTFGQWKQMSRREQDLHVRDIAEVKRLVGDKVCLIGNVNCGLLDTGTEEQIVESARYALKHGMPGGGYIFSTSNCIYTGMDPTRYELMLDVWRKEGNYDAQPPSGAASTHWAHSMGSSSAKCG